MALIGGGNRQVDAVAADCRLPPRSGAAVLYASGEESPEQIACGRSARRRRRARAGSGKNRLEEILGRRAQPAPSCWYSTPSRPSTPTSWKAPRQRRSGSGMRQRLMRFAKRRNRRLRGGARDQRWSHRGAEAWNTSPIRYSTSRARLARLPAARPPNRWVGGRAGRLLHVERGLSAVVNRPRCSSPRAEGTSGSAVTALMEEPALSRSRRRRSPRHG
jgi:hypothetical protein